MFARVPVPGQVKTRLGRVLGYEAAAALHAAFVEDVCALTRGTARRRVLAVAGPTDGAAAAAMEALAEREGMEVWPQGEGDLGQRMARAMARGLGEGASRVCIVGSDSPALPPSLVVAGFDALAGADVVLGPAQDGGYWLVGARREVPWLFEAMAWGTPSVLEDSLSRLRSRGVPHALAPRFWDVDEPGDLVRLREALAAQPALAPRSRAALSALVSDGKIDS